jgi:NOL1/NOP2/fmu family ribosome biogenesis protein
MSEKEKVLQDLEERFGIDKMFFNSFSFALKGNKIWIFKSSVLNKNLDGLRIESAGIPLVRYFSKKKKDMNNLKPTTEALQIFGKLAEKNLIVLNDQERDKYIQGLDIEKKPEGVTNGFVIITCKEGPLGCGLYKNGFIKNQIPKNKWVKR